MSPEESSRTHLHPKHRQRNPSNKKIPLDQLQSLLHPSMEQQHLHPRTSTEQEHPSPRKLTKQEHLNLHPRKLTKQEHLNLHPRKPTKQEHLNLLPQSRHLHGCLTDLAPRTNSTPAPSATTTDRISISTTSVVRQPPSTKQPAGAYSFLTSLGNNRENFSRKSELQASSTAQTTSDNAYWKQQL